MELTLSTAVEVAASDELMSGLKVSSLTRRHFGARRADTGATQQMLNPRIGRHL
jgi:hypothetical protein